MHRRPFANDGSGRWGWLALGLLAGTAAAALLPSGCKKDGTGPEPPTLLGVGVSPDTLQFISLNLNQQLTVTGNTTTGNVDLTSDPGTSYVSRDAGVVTVGATGSVTSVANGTTRVVISNGGFSDSAVAVVSAVVLTGVDATPDTVVLPAIGARIQLTVTGTTTTGQVDLTTNPQTTYVSRDQAVVGAVAGGQVNAVAAGQAYVVASNGGFSDSVLADVDLASALAVTSLSLSPASTTIIVVGDSVATNSTIVWENGARRDGPGSPIVYTTDDALVAEIHENGFIVAIGEGSTSVHASIGGEIKTSDVTVAHQVLYQSEIFQAIFNAPFPFTKNCAGGTCHINAISYGNGLHLDTHDNLMAGGVNGPVVVSGDPAVSRIVRALRGTLSDICCQMPRDRGALPESLIVRIENWIDQGAQDN
jgi:hypothetical protein